MLFFLGLKKWQFRVKITSDENVKVTMFLMHIYFMLFAFYWYKRVKGIETIFKPFTRLYISKTRFGNVKVF